MVSLVYTQSSLNVSNMLYLVHVMSSHGEWKDNIKFSSILAMVIRQIFFIHTGICVFELFWLTLDNSPYILSYLILKSVLLYNSSMKKVPFEIMWSYSYMTH